MKIFNGKEAMSSDEESRRYNLTFNHIIDGQLSDFTVFITFNIVILNNSCGFKSV